MIEQSLNTGMKVSGTVKQFVGLDKTELPEREVLCFDIETYKWEYDEKFAEFMAGGKLGNRVDPAKIKDKIALNREKFALSPLTGQIILFGAFDGKDYTIILGDERDIIIQALDFLSANVFNGVRLVSKAGKRFDLPYLMQRAAILGIETNFNVSYSILTKKYDTFNHIDFEDLLEGGLHQWGYLLGLTDHIENPANQIGEWYEQGMMDTIIEKNKEDLKITYELYRRLKWANL